MTDDSNRDFSGAVNQSPGMNEREADDIIWRLRERIGIPGRFGYSPDCQLLADAANEIERLRAPAPSVEHPFDRDMSKPGAATALARELAAPAPSAWQPDPRTIEECAKFAESFRLPYWLNVPINRQIAAAIRALSLPFSDRGGVG